MTENMPTPVIFSRYVSPVIMRNSAWYSLISIATFGEVSLWCSAAERCSEKWSPSRNSSSESGSPRVSTLSPFLTLLVCLFLCTGPHLLSLPSWQQIQHCWNGGTVRAQLLCWSSFPQYHFWSYFTVQQLRIVDGGTTRIKLSQGHDKAFWGANSHILIRTYVEQP